MLKRIMVLGTLVVALALTTAPALAGGSGVIEPGKAWVAPALAGGEGMISPGNATVAQQELAGGTGGLVGSPQSVADNGQTGVMSVVDPVTITRVAN